MSVFSFFMQNAEIRVGKGFHTLFSYLIGRIFISFKTTPYPIAPCTCNTRAYINNGIK